MKSGQKTLSIEEKLDVISWLEKDEQIVDICHTVTLVVYIQFMILLIELKQVLCQGREW